MQCMGLRDVLAHVLSVMCCGMCRAQSVVSMCAESVLMCVCGCEVSQNNPPYDHVSKGDKTTSVQRSESILIALMR